MRRKHTHLRSTLLRSHHRGWVRILTAILILATTAANLSAVGLLHLCPIRGTAETDICCCPELEATEAALSDPTGHGECPASSAGQTGRAERIGRTERVGVAGQTGRAGRVGAPDPGCCSGGELPESGLTGTAPNAVCPQTAASSPDLSRAGNSTLSSTDRCGCGRLLLVEDSSEGVVRVSSEFDFAAVALAIELPWIASPQDRRLVWRPDHSPPRAPSRPAYLLFSSWTC